MHVLHVIDGLGLGGAERMLIDIANQTSADGHRVTVCVTRSDVQLADELAPAIELVVLGRQSRFALTPIARFVRLVRELRVDVLHVHMQSNLSFVLPLRMLRLVRAPIVFHDHYGTIEVDTTTPRWFRVGARWIDRYVGVYAPLCDWAEEAGVPAARTSVIANALDLTRLTSARPHDLRGELGLAGDPRRLAIVVATQRRDKDLIGLLDAVAPHRARLVVAIAGAEGEADYVAALRERHRELELGNCVHFLGGRRDVPALLPAADLAILPSRTESGPLALIEYLAVGLPIVATRVGDIGRRLAALGVVGFVEPGDSSELSRALDDLVSLDPVAARARGADGRAILEQHWEIRSVMPRWYALYRDAIASA